MRKIFENSKERKCNDSAKINYQTTKYLGINDNNYNCFIFSNS